MGVFCCIALQAVRWRPSCKAPASPCSSSSLRRRRLRPPCWPGPRPCAPSSRLSKLRCVAANGCAASDAVCSFVTYTSRQETWRVRWPLLPDKTPGAEALTACYHAMLTEQRLLERELDGDTGDSMSDHGNLSEFSVRNNDNYPPRPTPEREAALRAAVSAPHPLKNWPLPDPDKTKAALSVPDTGWPEAMHDSAFQGLAGDFVRLVLPETEADPAALLLTFLVGVGSMIGRGPHYRVGASKHSVNLFGVVVGEDVKGAQRHGDRPGGAYSGAGRSALHGHPYVVRPLQRRRA